MTNHRQMILVASLFLAVSGCVSHRIVLNDPISTLIRWDKLDATLPGTALNIQLETGMMISGRFQASTGDQLTVSGEGETETNIAKADVVQITAAGADSLNNGAAWGVGIGALGAWGGAASQGAGAAAAGFVQPFVLALLLDWLHQEHEVIYIAP